MSGDSQQYPDPRHKWLALALIGIAVTVAWMPPVIYALFGDSVKLWNASIIGALGLFAASRFGFWWAVGIMGLAIGLKDIGFYFTRDWPANPLSLVWFIAYGAIGSAFLRHSQSPLRIGAGAISGSILFFISWLEPQLGYEQSLSGLVTCYKAGVPFFRGTLIGDLVYSGALFGAHAALCQAYNPVRQPVGVEAEQKANNKEPNGL
jgi:hypothetical protein